MSIKDERMTEFESNQAPMFECAAGKIEQFVATSETIRRSIVERGSTPP